MVITKWFSINTYDNVRHSAVKFLYAEGFAGYYRDRLLKETSPNRLLLTPKNSLTMKQYRSSTNNSDGILSVSFSVQLPFNLRSSSVHPPFVLRSTSVRAPFELRSTSVRAPFELRSGIGERSENERRTKEDVTITHRCKNEGAAKHKKEPTIQKSNQTIIFLSLNFKLLWQDLMEIVRKINEKINGHWWTLMFKTKREASINGIINGH